jgi:hypothetical protein
MKILSVEAELLQAETDGEAAMTKLIVAFRNFVNTRNNKTHHIRHGSYPRNSTLVWFLKRPN